MQVLYVGLSINWFSSEGIILSGGCSLRSLESGPVLVISPMSPILLASPGMSGFQSYRLKEKLVSWEQGEDIRGFVQALS